MATTCEWNEVAEPFTCHGVRGRLQRSSVCNGYLAGHSPIRQCTEKNCCRRNLIVHFDGDLVAFQRAVEMERNSMAAHSRDELHDMLRQIVEVDHRQARAGVPKEKHVSPAHIHGIGVCAATWYWFHGVSGTAYRRVRETLDDEGASVDGRRIKKGPTGEGRLRIIVWANKNLKDWGSWMPPCARTGNREVLKLTLISPQRDL